LVCHGIIKTMLTGWLLVGATREDMEGAAFEKHWSHVTSSHDLELGPTMQITEERAPLIEVPFDGVPILTRVRPIEHSRFEIFLIKLVFVGRGSQCRTDEPSAGHSPNRVQRDLKLALQRQQRNEPVRGVQVHEPLAVSYHCDRAPRITFILKREANRLQHFTTNIYERDTLSLGRWHHLSLTGQAHQHASACLISHRTPSLHIP
jgi:hypothetical protein